MVSNDILSCGLSASADVTVYNPKNTGTWLNEPRNNMYDYHYESATDIYNRVRRYISDTKQIRKNF